MAKRLLLFVHLFFAFAVLRGQNISNKKIPVEVEAAIVQALTFFPELDDYSIEFKFRNHLNNRVMQAQPKISTLFRSKEKRHYKITMSRNLEMHDTTMTVDQLPYDILVGWFAHELGHIMDYRERTSANLIRFAAKYLTSKPFIKRSEKRADTYAVGNGCAKEIINTKKFILFKSKFTKEYKAKMKDLYPSPEDITAMVEE